MSRYEDLRRTLTKRRLDLGWSQRDLSERMGVGQSFLSNLESGKNHSPTLDTLHRWCRSLKMQMLLDAEPYDDDEGR